MIRKPIDSVTADDFRALIDDSMCEARTIEYNRESMTLVAISSDD